MTEVKPCPYCGSKDINITDGYVSCEICEATIERKSFSYASIKYAQKQAIQVWNTRIEDPRIKQLTEENERLKEQLNNLKEWIDSIDRSDSPRLFPPEAMVLKDRNYKRVNDPRTDILKGAGE